MATPSDSGGCPQKVLSGSVSVDVFLIQEQISPPENIWQYLETFLTITAGVVVMLARKAGQHPSMHGTAPTVDSYWPNTSVVLKLRRSALLGGWNLVVPSSSARVLPILPRCYLDPTRLPTGGGHNIDVE